MGNSARKTPAAAFGEVVRELRASKGLTQEALALEVGTERSHISALERAEKGPSIATIFRLARALGISSGVLMDMVQHKLEDRKRP